jgi:hypothetical protein
MMPGFRAFVKQLRSTAAATIVAWASSCASADGIIESTKMVPADVGFFVAVDHPTELRVGLVGGFALAVVDSVAGFVQTFDAWDRLAKELGWTGAEAFDALLGTRVVFAAKTVTEEERAADQAAGPGPSLGAWVLMSQVTDATAQRLTQRLKPMPRELVAGTPVLSVENGRFLLGLARRDAVEGFTLMVVEGEHADFLATALRQARAGPEVSLWTSPKIDDLRPLSDGADAVISMDMGAFGAPKGEERPNGWLGAALRRNTKGLSVQSVMLMPEAVGAQAPVGPACRGWSPDAFERLAQTAVFASVESNSIVSATAVARGWSKGFERFASMIGLAADFPEKANLTGRLVSLVTSADKGVFDAAVAIESDRIGAMSQLGDTEMARVVAGVTRRIGAVGEIGGAPDADAAAFDLGVLPTRATRSIDISSIAGEAISSSWEGGAKLVWRYVPHQAGPAPAEAEDAPGWWIIGLGRSAVDTLAKAQLSRREGEPSVPWYSMVSARPRLGVQRLEAMGVPIIRPLESMRWVERVTWNSILGPRKGMMLGGGRVELVRP